MGNTYFNFKKFAIQQSECAMKVTTDACILGAWASIPAGATHVLDIGAGSGLLSLMLAQRNPLLKIDAIEIDGSAAAQAATNFELSPWKDRLSLIHADVTTITLPTRYDFIITNPPFFTASLLGPDLARNRARHHVSLSLHQLVVTCGSLIQPDGCLTILLPLTEQKSLVSELTEEGWGLVQELMIGARENAAPSRIISTWQKTYKGHVQKEQLYIKKSDNNYTNEFMQLLSDFYLAF